MWKKHKAAIIAGSAGAVVGAAAGVAFVGWKVASAPAGAVVTTLKGWFTTSPKAAA